MELIQKNIHMDRVSAEALSQFTLEDDVNIPDSKPDVDSLSLEKGMVVIDELKCLNDSVTVKGRMQYSVLYHTKEDGGRLVSLEGYIPFEEKINLQGANPSDITMAEGKVEDLSVGMINSRKLGVQSLITMQVWTEELYDEEAPIGFAGADGVEYRQVMMNIAQIAISKNDIFRIREEITLPAGYANIFQILWNDVALGDVEFRAMEEKIMLQGDIHLFVLYEGEGEERPVRSFETTVPFDGSLECHGCAEGMIPDIYYRVGQPELTVRPDLDGEERVIGVEMAMDIPVRIYEEEELGILSDMYGITKEFSTISHRANLRRLLSRVTGKTKVNDRIRIVGDHPSILQLLHSEATVLMEAQQAVQSGILLRGSLNVKVMYITGDDEQPYASVTEQFPYEYTLEVPGVTQEDCGRVRIQVEQLQVTMLDGEEMDVKAVLSFDTTVFKNIPMDLIGRVEETELDSARLNSLPGMIIYMVKAGDNLWNIGKRYYVPVEAIRQMNGLESDELRVGQKLLIVV
ncbi:MAG: DUF3794 domain-containing protein [Acetatifactor sp.]|nr:DUF3794 domain-containing protein [Acetatifactor sp.]